MAVRDVPGTRAAALRALLRDHQRSDTSIATVIGCAHATVSLARARLEAAGVLLPWRSPWPPRPAERLRAAAWLLDASPQMTGRQIATVLGCSEATVSHARRAIGLGDGRQANGRQRTAAGRLAEELLREDLAAPTGETAAIAGCSWATVQRIRRELLARGCQKEVV